MVPSLERGGLQRIDYAGNHLSQVQGVKAQLDVPKGAADVRCHETECGLRLGGQTADQQIAADHNDRHIHPDEKAVEIVVGPPEFPVPVTQFPFTVWSSSFIDCISSLAVCSSSLVLCSSSLLRFRISSLADL